MQDFYLVACHQLGHQLGTCCFGNAYFLGFVLVGVGMSGDDDRLFPCGDGPRYVGADDGFAKNSAIEGVANRAVGRGKKAFEVKLSFPFHVGGNRRTFYAHVVLGYGFGGVKGDGIVSGVTPLDTEVVDYHVQLKKRDDELFFDEIPDDSCHLIAIENDNGLGDGNFGCHVEILGRSFIKRALDSIGESV